jgi:hypothetical protein
MANTTFNQDTLGDIEEQKSSPGSSKRKTLYTPPPVLTDNNSDGGDSSKSSPISTSSSESFSSHKTSTTQSTPLSLNDVSNSSKGDNLNSSNKTSLDGSGANPPPLTSNPQPPLASYPPPTSFNTAPNPNGVVNRNTYARRIELNAMQNNNIKPWLPKIIVMYVVLAAIIIFLQKWFPHIPLFSYIRALLTHAIAPVFVLVCGIVNFEDNRVRNNPKISSSVALEVPPASDIKVILWLTMTWVGGFVSIALVNSGVLVEFSPAINIVIVKYIYPWAVDEGRRSNGSIGRLLKGNTRVMGFTAHVLMLMCDEIVQNIRYLYRSVRSVF